MYRNTTKVLSIVRIWLVGSNARYAKNDDISLNRSCRGTSIVKEFFKHSLPRWRHTRHYPPRSVDGNERTCVDMHTARLADAYFGEELQGTVYSLLPLSLFMHNTPSLREHVTLLTAQDAEGNIYRLAGKAKRLAFHRYRLRFHACRDSGRQATAYTWTPFSKGQWHHRYHPSKFRKRNDRGITLLLLLLSQRHLCQLVKIEKTFLYSYKNNIFNFKIFFCFFRS